MKKVQQLPEGATNLKDFFPEVYFPDVEEWKVQAIDENNEVIMTSRLNKKECCCDIRIHFVNSMGQLDALNFRHLERMQESKSGVWEKPQSRNFDVTKGGRYRQNITTEDQFELETSFYLESELSYIKDFANSPMHFIEYDIENGFQNSLQKNYVPFLIQECKIPQKAKDIFEFQIQVKGQLSNQRINFR
ncbi:hypothetical protein FNJ88_11135 [Chryseobacterium sp. SNU WT5]|uniref:hypothetical protein n=1 Tax=Chryseobacterium sp. SNU WT5 TaxID=2594269 RepID=UPI00117C9956|nr:hypothetical protein [Chryseobacterium sp. SNU WT5]QDP86073.1 hypothetical protein FNJ88_11135 [Chryseobacterium sp. SNU WT5]